MTPFERGFIKAAAKAGLSEKQAFLFFTKSNPQLKQDAYNEYMKLWDVPPTKKCC